MSCAELLKHLEFKNLPTLWQKAAHSEQAVQAEFELSYFPPPVEVSCFPAVAELSCFPPAIFLVFKTQAEQAVQVAVEMNCFLPTV
ncbi:hypothetical protein NPIL_647431 [Nephila pilipes]|uniref:Uncharacterized protein n=1 Tax=Nephila pilipes TaxID=299642 RepID=A0A8X6TLM6_NEPPI|nr:hypothetical protein NPIL_647431 [Nephila pilipes]